MAIFGLKTAILDFKIAMDLSENIFIWTALKSYTSESSFIRFSAFLLCFQGPSRTVGPKNGYFWPENGHFGFQNGQGAFWKYFHLNGIKKLSNESSFIRFSAFLLWFLGPSHTVGAKNGYFWPENGHFGFQNGHGAFWKYFHLNGIEKLY